MVDCQYVSDKVAYKLFIRDLTTCSKENNSWQIEFGNNTEPKDVNLVMIQATVVKIMGFENEIMIVDDRTGKAKITRGKKVPGDFSWLKTGSVCSIIGALVDGGKLPHIDVVKMAEVENPVQLQMWPLEVNELRNFFAEKISPNVQMIINYS